MQLLIGIVGEFNVGKDTVADILIHEYFPKHKLKGMKFSVSNMIARDICSLCDGFAAPLLEHKNTDPKARWLLQHYGWNMVEELGLGKNYWFKQLEPYFESFEGVAIITNVRKIQEFEFVKNHPKGVTVRVRRPIEKDTSWRRGTAAWDQKHTMCRRESILNEHPSETELRGFVTDFFINNDGTLEQLRHNVAYLFECISQKLQ